MKRPTIAVSVRDADTGETMHTETRSAWNAANKAGADAIRTIARSEGQLYSGGSITRSNADRYRLTPGDTMSRPWTGDKTGRRLTATITVETTP